VRLLLLLSARLCGPGRYAQWRVGRPIPWLCCAFLSLLRLVAAGSAGAGWGGWAMGPHPGLTSRCWAPTLTVHQGVHLLLARHRVAAPDQPSRRCLELLPARQVEPPARPQPLNDGPCSSRANASNASAATKPPVLAAAKASAPCSGQRLEPRPGASQPLSADSHAHVLNGGSHRGLLLPDRPVFAGLATAAGPGGPAADRADGWSGNLAGSPALAA